MNSMQLVKRMTADEYLAQDYDGIPTWLVEGEVVFNQPELLHQMVLMDLIRALRGWTDAASSRGLLSLPLDVKLDERNVFAPDLMWYAEDRAPARHDKRQYPLPDLAVEVRSPSTWRYDVGAKWLAYERAGLRELWLVDTVSRTVIVCRRSDPAASTFDVLLEVAAGEQLASPQLPGFALPVASLFAD
jgi:Uma2 family endonuclease